MTRSRFHRVALTLALLAIGATPWLQAQGALNIRMEWRKISGGTVHVTIYPGGVLGDETELVRQIGEGRIQAAALSSAGLSRIDNAVSCLQVPMMFDSYAELDYVRLRLAPTLERRIERRGFKVLNWTDGGWVRTFTRKPARTPD